MDSSLSIKRYKADQLLVMFDFDGLLVDTEQMHYEAYRQMCLAHGITLQWDYVHYSLLAQRTSDGIRQALYAEYPLMHTLPPWKELYAHKTRLIQEMYHTVAVNLQPGAQELLHYLNCRHIERCVVTHSPLELVTLLTHRHAILKTIPHWITREDYVNPKPAPDCYLTAMERLLPENGMAIGFEDTPRGLTALLDSGAEAVLVPQCDYPELETLRQRGAHVIASLAAAIELFSPS